MSNPKNYIDSSQDLGWTARRVRRESGLTQARAASLCGVGTRFLSDLENGKPSLHFGKVLRVLRGLGLVLTVQRKIFRDG